MPSTQDDPQKRKPSIQRAKDVLGWEPKVKVETIQYVFSKTKDVGMQPL